MSLCVSCGRSLPCGCPDPKAADARLSDLFGLVCPSCDAYNDAARQDCMDCGSLLEERLVAASDIDSVAHRATTRPELPVSPAAAVLAPTAPPVLMPVAPPLGPPVVQSTVDALPELELNPDQEPTVEATLQTTIESTQISKLSEPEPDPLAQLDVIEESDILPGDASAPTVVLPADQMPAPWSMDAPPILTSPPPRRPAANQPIITPIVNAIPLVAPKQVTEPPPGSLPATNALLLTPAASLKPVALVTPSAVQPLGRACVRCGTTNPSDYRFCGSCGAPLGQAAEPQAGVRVRQPLAPGRAAARVLRGERLGQILPLGMQASIGRGSCEVSFPRDPYLASTHCTLVFEMGRLIVHDEGGSSGTFVRIYEEENIAAGDLFSIGDHLLTFAGALAVPVAAEDGTRLAGGPRPPQDAIKLEEVHEGLVPGRTVVRRGPSIVLGRDEACDVTFPGDRFVSSRHCGLTVGMAGRSRIKDLGSTNGTFRRLTSGGERELFKGDCIRVGGEVLQFVES